MSDWTAAAGVVELSGGRNALTDVDLFVAEQRADSPWTVLLVHGWGGDHTVWAPMMQIVGPGVEVIAPDLRGHGRSGRARTPHTIAGMADDLAELLAQRGLREVVVVGHSMGGNVAVDLADRHRDLVRAVVAVDPAYGDRAWADADEREVDLVQRGTQAPLQSLSQAFHPGSDPALRARVGPVLEATVPVVLIEALRSTYTDTDAFGHLPDTHRKLSRLDRPLLSLYADPDAAVRAEAFPVQHRIETIADTGHFIPLEQPSVLWSRILGWLTDLPTSPGGRR